MIHALLRDTGTVPLITENLVPGMDELRWREADFEESVLETATGERMRALNSAVMDAGYVNVSPWPRPIPRQAHVDATSRHAGLELVLRQCGQLGGTWSDVPGGRRTVDSTPLAFSRRVQAASRMDSVDEVRAKVAQPGLWIRLVFDNEKAGTRLEEPLHLTWYGVQGRLTLAMPDNDLFTPFDLSTDRYEYLQDDGSAIDRREVARWYATFGSRARLIVYLRPRRWRWYASVLAHFVEVAGPEMVLNDVVYPKVWYDRPPFAPVRHDIVHTRGNRQMWHEYAGGYVDWDPGVDSSWQLSRAFAELQHEILLGQGAAWCQWTILLGVEPAVINLWRMPPRQFEVVCGLGVVDQVVGVERRVWVRQRKDLSSIYPQQAIGTFFGNFWA